MNTVQATGYALENVFHLYKQLPTTFFKGVSYPANDLSGNPCKIRRTSKNGAVYLHIIYKSAHYVVNMETHAVTIR